MRKQIEDLGIQLSEILKEKHFSLVSAESCTGGGLFYHLSKIPECPSFLERGFITYSPQSKQELLEVKPESLQLHGAVSEPIAKEMAEGALKNSRAHISIAITGMAGSDKDNHNEKGSVWIGCAGILNKSHTQFEALEGQREIFGEETIIVALKVLIYFLKKFY